MEDMQGATCLHDGIEVLEEKERFLEEMGHAKGPATGFEKRKGRLD
jgi:hypothetical protein